MIENSNKNPLSYLTEEMLFEVLSQAADNVYLFKADLATGFSIWSRNAEQYFGLPEGYNCSLMDAWQPHIHPDDVEGYLKDVDAVFSGKKMQHFYQYRALNAAGEYVWVECSGHVNTDPGTGRKFFAGLITRLDVTGKYDPITNCLNLKEFYLKHYTEDCTLLLLGIDRFRKTINQIGFTESNQILALLGSILQHNSIKDTVFRMTGDEFLILLPTLSKEEIEYFYDKIQREFKHRVAKLYPGLHAGFSGGAAHYAIRKDSKEEILRRLELCLDFSKQHGSEQLTKYSAFVEEGHEYTIKLQKALSHAIANNFEGFKLVYQPIIRAEDKVLDGAEALLRFYTDDLGMVSPADFIPLLEASGDILPVGKWVAEQAILQKVAWEKLRPGLRVGFNVSLLQLRDRVLSDYVVELVRKYQLPPDEIIVEMTESHKMEDAERLRDVLLPLTQEGIWVFLDDFGMEASNFTLVQELDVDGIKVDHSFVRTMIGNKNKRKDQANIAIVSSISNIGKMLNLRVVVEGVENQQIDQLLCDMNIQYMQGYYYARPMPAEIFERLFKKASVI